MYWTVGFLALYTLLILGTGVFVGRRVSTQSDFFVAGRSLGPGLLCVTVLAANIGAGSTVLAASLGYQFGISAWWWVGSAGIGTILLGQWIGPRIHRAAKLRGFLTVGDFLEERYGPGTRLFLATLLWLGSLSILAAQLIAMAWILDVTTGAPKWLGAVAGGAVMTAYYAAGGLLGSAWVNLVQLVVLLGGFLAAAVFALQRVGGADAALAALSDPVALPGFLHYWGNGDAGWMYLVLLVPAFVSSPGLLQKTFGARDAGAIRRGLTACGVALMVFAAIPPLLGMFTRILEPGIANPEAALPTLLVEWLPPWVGLLGLAAVLSAEISSADAILFMLSTSVARDLYKRVLRPDASGREVLRATRIVAIAGGCAGVGLAILIPTIASALAIFYSLLGASLLVPLVAGLHLKGLRAPEALAAACGGSLTLLIFGYIVPSDGAVTAIAWALLAAAGAFSLTRLLRGATSANGGRPCAKGR